ncbi:MAG TPA: hypothetical protein VGQ71_04270, partial [Terriglobales bacterium]|nr:hypothetical protein [Terriglobales bacterium]
MSFRLTLAVTIASVLILVLAGCASPSQLDSTFDVSVAAAADDLIETGSVRTGPGDQVEVFVDVEFSTGTLPLTYTVAFCPFATGTANCTVLGSLQDQGGGILSGILHFPSTGVFAGVFTFTREGTVQFMTGLYKPGRGDFFFDVGLQPISAVSGGLGPGFTPGSDPLSRGSVKIDFSGVSGT